VVGVNMHGSLDPAIPFGGSSNRAGGAKKGREVLDLYTEVKSVVMSL
jgi:phenylacetaldehyde dehydrogenase